MTRGIKALRKAASVLTLAADTAEAVGDAASDPNLKRDIVREVKDSAFRIGSRVLSAKPKKE